ncbi:MAG: hypothetical protein ABI600_03600 [Luteolibacter sp.]
MILFLSIHATGGVEHQNQRTQHLRAGRGTGGVAGIAAQHLTKEGDQAPLGILLCSDLQPSPLLSTQQYSKLAL